LITVKIKGPVEQEKIDSVVKELVQEYEISEDKVKIRIPAFFLFVFNTASTLHFSTSIPAI